MSQRTNTKLLEKGTKLWLVLRSTQNQLSRQGVRIKEGDVVKMGRVKFRVREINLFMKKEQLYCALLRVDLRATRRSQASRMR